MYAEAYYILDKRICNKTIGILFSHRQDMDIFPTPYSWVMIKTHQCFYSFQLILMFQFLLKRYVNQMDIYLNKGKFPRDIIVLVHFPDMCIYGNFHFRLFSKSFVLIQKLRTPKAVQKLSTKYSCIVSNSLQCYMIYIFRSKT